MPYRNTPYITRHVLRYEGASTIVFVVAPQGSWLDKTTVGIPHPTTDFERAENATIVTNKPPA